MVKSIKIVIFTINAFSSCIQIYFSLFQGLYNFFQDGQGRSEKVTKSPSKTKKVVIICLLHHKYIYI